MIPHHNVCYWPLAILLSSLSAVAKVDLVTLPDRDGVEVTIYNSADMTLVRETRILTLEKGTNRLQFSWANTLIDPTSLELVAKVTGVEVEALSYPPRTQNVGVWNIVSDKAGEVPMEITYLTSGLNWRAFYMGTLSEDEKFMQLEGYVRVQNNSGEDYEEASTRLIVGQVHLLDEIAALARRSEPYGSPVHGMRDDRDDYAFRGGMEAKSAVMEMAADAVGYAVPVASMAPKQIIKEGLSEYFLYSIEGKETLENGWAKRLPSFEAGQIPVTNLYKYEAERYGPSVLRFLSFKNDEDHKLGTTPIPGGNLEIYRKVSKAGNLSYEGESEFKYIPVDEDVELNLGPVENVVVESKVMNFRATNHLFDAHGDVSGWDEVRSVKVECRNTRDVPVRLELTVNTQTQHWDLEHREKAEEYQKVDLDTVRFTLTLGARSKRDLSYVLTTRHGRRAE